MNPSVVLSNHGDFASSLKQPLRLFGLLVYEANVGCAGNASDTQAIGETAIGFPYANKVNPSAMPCSLLLALLGAH
jgi:hypothetical protein